MNDLIDKRVVVTGASRGAGRGIACAFGAAGARLILTARNAAGLEKTRAMIEREGGRVDALIAADLSTRQGCIDVARQCGDVDVLVNNAAQTTAKFRSLLEPDEEYWQRQMQLNLYAPLTLMQELVPHMVRMRSGSIINISSIVAQRGIPCHAPLTSSKAAMEAMSKVAAMELAPHNINVVVVALGNTDTEALAEACADGVTVEEVRRFAPLGRLVKVDEVAALCVHLAREHSRAITGVVIAIDGALTTGMHVFSETFGHS